jgi:hypothetical protein
MIGQVIFRVSERRGVAELSDDLAWRCDSVEVQQMLDEQFPAYFIADEDTETLGRHMLYRAAYRLGGEVRLSRRRPTVGV